MSTAIEKRMGGHEKECELSVRVIPNASRDEVVGWYDGILKIKTPAQPESGKANQAVCLLLARFLELPKRSVLVVSGQKNHSKRLRVEGMSEDELKARLIF